MKQLLYKITKTQHEREYDPHTHTYGDYHETRRRVDYRTHKGAVTLSLKNVEQSNAQADRIEAQYPGQYNMRRYKVEVEACDLPDFHPVTFCEKHGMQIMLEVPGLTSEPTCLECI